MRRRDSIKLIGGALGSSLLERRGLSRSSADREVTFFVAGARFQAIRGRALAGDHVRLVAGTFGGQRCYEVLRGEERLGYVPKKVTSALEGRSQLVGTLSRVSSNSVPWRRYRVSVLV